MDDYEKVATDASESVVKEHKKQTLRQYMADNWIAIVALIVAIIALFK